MPGFVLVHGYTGSPLNLGPLAEFLAARFGPGSVCTLCLPGHDQDAPPPYDEAGFLRAIAEATQALGHHHERIVLLGHSTGGTLCLAAMAQKLVQPDLLVLIATPQQVDGTTLDRWERHRAGRPALGLGDVARMVRHINQMGTLSAPPGVPALLIQGSLDPLVPFEDADAWARQGFQRMRRLTVPWAGHDLFGTPSATAVAEWIARQVDDFLSPADSAVEAAAEQLAILEGPHLGRFLRVNPQARRHLANTPATRQALGAVALPLSDEAPEPIQLNIEVSSRCNLGCPHCARTRNQRPASDMDPAFFNFLLDLLPNAYRVVLAGLGEPTLHPRLPELVAAAAGRHRLVNLVTNATLLSTAACRSLIEAGLGALTFSLDAADSSIAAAVRPGVAVARILANIRACAPLAAAAGIATAVFTAVSARTVGHLPRLAETVAGLGVQAWMLTDLNFDWNQPHSLDQTLDSAVRTAIRQALRAAFARKLPVLAVQGLEQFALARRYRDFLLYPPERLAVRSPARIHCLSPWQTLPVDVTGHASVCDCHPAAVLGNLHDTPLGEIWNGPRMQAWRRQMLSATPPEACRACPRF